MLPELTRVVDVLPTRDLIPALTCLHFYDNRVQASDGLVTIETDCPCEHEFTANGLDVFRAISASGDRASINLTDQNITFTSPNFRARIRRFPDADYPRQSFENAGMENRGLIDGLRLLQPFISDERSVRNLCGVRFDGEGWMWVADPRCIVRYPMLTQFEQPFVLPQEGITQLVRIGEEPKTINVERNKITFYYPWGAMAIRTLEDDWPDLEQLLPNGDTYVDTTALRNEVEAMLPFLADVMWPVVELDANGMHIASSEEGREVKLSFSSYPESRFNAQLLHKVVCVASDIDLTPYPDGCPFRGENGLEGVVIGVR